MKVAPDCTYEPDFMVLMADYSVEFHEVKGGFITDDGMGESKVGSADVPMVHLPHIKYDRKGLQGKGAFTTVNCLIGAAMNRVAGSNLPRLIRLLERKTEKQNVDCGMCHCRTAQHQPKPDWQFTRQPVFCHCPCRRCVGGDCVDRDPGEGTTVVETIKLRCFYAVPQNLAHTLNLLDRV